MTLAISMLNNNLPCILKCKIIISSIPIYYTKCHNVNKTSLKKFSYIDE